MSKYIRSLHKLRCLTQDIFVAPEISIDTKAIVLFLAGSTHSTDFIPWIDRISALDRLNIRLKEINNLRAELGPICHEYLVLSILNVITRDINDSELQQFISEGCLPSKPLQVTAENIQDVTQHACLQLQQRLENIMEPQLGHIVDTYTSCRSQANPETAYKAVVNAMQDILVASGETAAAASEYSRKIAAMALDQFNSKNEPTDKILLFSKTTPGRS